MRIFLVLSMLILMINRGLASPQYKITFSNHQETLPITKIADPEPTQNHLFGRDVVITERYAAIGATSDDNGKGVVYLYTFDPVQKSYVQTDTLRASDAAANAWFGFSLSMENNELLIGAPGSGGNKAYLFQIDPNTGKATQKSIITEASNSKFGNSVKITNGTLFISAPEASPSPALPPKCGAVYAYEYDTSTGETNKVATLTATDAETDAEFGKSIDAVYTSSDDNTTIVVGSPGKSEDKGAVYVFKNNGSSNQIEMKKYTLTAPTANDRLGESVSVDTDFFLAGAPGKETGQGRVYIFGHTSTQEHELLTLLPSQQRDGMNFGQKVLFHDGTALVTAKQYSQTGMQKGAIFKYVLDTNDLNKLIRYEDEILRAEDTQWKDDFGFAIDMVTAYQTDRILIGAPQSGTSGTAYIFLKGIYQHTFENKYDAIKIVANDAYGHTDEIRYALEGMDATLFTIDPVSGEVQFKQKPDFEHPHDNNGDNLYKLFVKAYIPNMTERRIPLFIQVIDEKNEEQEIPNVASFKHVQAIVGSTIEEDSQFGEALAIEDDILVIGAPNQSNGGAAYIFKYDKIQNQFIQKAILTSTNLSSGDRFGFSVAISGDTIVIGSPGKNSGKGIAYLFYKPASGWTDMTESTKLYPSDNANVEQFGYSVDIENKTIVVGQLNEHGTDTGIYVYDNLPLNATAAFETARLYPENEPSRFGYSVSISGNTIIAGTNTYPENVYLFEKPFVGWSNHKESAILSPSLSGSDAAWFGQSVSIHKDSVIIGSLGGGNLEGVAFVYKQPKTGWQDMNETAKLLPHDPHERGRFANDVIVHNEQAVIAGYNQDGGKGAVYLYNKPADVWQDTTENKKIPNPTSTSAFGYKIAYDGNTLVVNNVNEKVNGVKNGVVHIYRNKPMMLPGVIMYLLN